jgi:hypothetical protein
MHQSAIAEAHQENREMR